MKRETYSAIATIATGSVALLAIAAVFLFHAYALDIQNLASSPADAPETPEEQETDMLFVGDVMLGRYVESLMRAEGENYPFEEMAAFMQSFDFVFGNLEGPIVAANHVQTPNNSTSFSFSSDKAGIVAKYFDMVSLGNNHTLDRGEQGFLDTQELLSEEGVLVTGHATDMDTAYAKRAQIDGVPVTFVGFNITFPTNDTDTAIETVQTLSETSDDLLIVNVHWGTEYILTSSQSQQEFAHALVDAGADVIIGHHPHVVQEIEEYKNVLIFYSLGNFVFDQYFSNDVQEGLAVGITLTEKTVTANLYPLQSTLSQPSIMNDSEKDDWLQELANRSDSELTEEILAGTITMTR